MAYSLTTDSPIVTSVYSEDELALVDLARVPSHIAIVMDGNRRWAENRSLPAFAGHWKGADALTQITRAASHLGVKTLTVYAFSTENWCRPQEEIGSLMHLFEAYLEQQREPMRQEGVRLHTIGDLSRLPASVNAAVEETKRATTDCKKIDLVLAMNYGGRDDIRRAILCILEDVDAGKLSRDRISEELIGTYLDTSHWPDPSLFIRTSGEKRQSNFLLWQLCYSEFYYTDVLWPDFQPKDLLDAVCDWQTRKRRLGV